MHHYDPSPGEEILSGGRLTAGVVRIGNTVRRPVQSSSRFVARLLVRLAKAGFDGAPRFLGRDDRDRDVLSFIPGWVPAKFQRFEKEQIHVAGQLLQRFHAATANSDLVKEGQVVCHRDPGPNNVVFQKGKPYAFIDFDLAAPGAPLDDIGYMVWTWCISSRPDRGPVAGQAEQICLLADAYGLGPSDRRGILQSVLKQQELNVHFWKTYRAYKPGTVPIRAEEIQRRIDWTEREMTYTEANQAIFERALV